MVEACERLPLRVLGYCLLRNHFHLVLWPRHDGDLSRWMQWLMTCHVPRYHKHYGGSGHVWQGRFKAFPIQQDEHLLTVLRYVERNPLRANLVARAEDASGLVSPCPVPLGRDWGAHVNRAQTEGEVAAVRRSITRGTPFGTDHWQQIAARRLGLESTLRPRGRPSKATEK
jgi:putative transposase